MAFIFLRAAIICGFAAFSSCASLAALTPEKATEMLARAQAADTKCSVLKITDRDELSTIVAQAEIALAETEGVEVTKAATARGRDLGSKVACDATTKQAVTEVYEAARSALGVTSLRSSGDTSTAEKYDRDEDEQATVSVNKDLPIRNAQQTSIAEKRPVAIKVAATKMPNANTINRKVAALATPKPLTAPKSKAPDSVNIVATKRGETKKFIALSSYGKLAENYYVELRCHKMPMVKVKKMYGEVLATHKQALAVHGKPAVKSLLQKAEARAKQASCG